MNTYTKVNEVDFFNLKGAFYKRGLQYFDSDSLVYGVIHTHRCAVFGTVRTSSSAYYKNSIIATLNLEANYYTLFYGDDEFYLKNKSELNLVQFLSENTLNGKLVSKDDLRINDKKCSLYSGKVNKRYFMKENKYRFKNKLK